MQTLMIKALDNGFAAEGIFSRYVVVSLKNRKVSILEVSYALNVPQSACTSSCWGVTIDTSKVSK